MTPISGRTSRRDLGTLFNLGVTAGRTDGQLLERFLGRRDAGAELAFAALVERHGPMVLRVCRGILGDEHEAMDAFQATFLVLVRKGGTLWVEDSLGPWLHRVACRAAGRAKAQADRRRLVERKAAETRAAQIVSHDRDDRAAALHEELDRLPDRYRVPIVLCDLEGRTCDEVARHLGCPVGTVKSWRARGQKQLRSRLARRGFTGLSSTSLAERLVTPPALAGSTLEAVMRMVAVRGTAGAVPAAVLTLTEGVLRAMFVTKLKLAAAVVAAGLFVTAFAGGVASALPDGSEIQGEAAKPVPNPVASALPPVPNAATATLARVNSWPLSLRDAILIGLENSEVVEIVERINDRGARGADVEDAANPTAYTNGQLVPYGQYSRSRAGGQTQYDVKLSYPLHVSPKRQSRTLVATPAGQVPEAPHADAGRVSQQGAGLAVTIAPVAAIAGDLWRFKAEVMAHVRSIEQQYWSLAQQHVQLGSCERALERAEEIVKREQFMLEVNRNTEANVAEAMQRLEQFRLDWVTKTSDVLTTERQLSNILGLPPDHNRRIVPVTVPSEARLEPDWDAAIAEMLVQEPDIARQNANLRKGYHLVKGPNSSPQVLYQANAFQKIVDKKRNALARFFLEIDANYKQFNTASLRRADAAKRLESQRAFYDEGRITTDRYFDAVSEYANTVAQEAQYRTTYNIAIVALEEAKGTLLTYDGIALSDVPRTASARTDRSGTGGTTPAGSNDERPATTGVNPPAPPPVDGHQASTGAKELTFFFTIGSARPVRIRGSITIGPAVDPKP